MHITKAEWKVMNAVWEKGSSASARDVLEMLEQETGWAYTTVKTIMNRLVERGALTVRRRANTNLYDVVISRRDARTLEVRSLLDRAFDGAFGPLVHFLLDEGDISDGDRDALQRKLDELADDGEDT